ncbi:adenosine kinase [Aureimonas altamirensis]|uniref:adenosine kinase n=1 Tax=Aureimonas altamirensis TaxID=370622 RepID=UPI00301ADD63
MQEYDLLTIGNAIVDVLSRTDDAALDALGVEKGAMTLVDEARAIALYGGMGPAIEMSGGSAGNTLAGFVSLGGRGAYFGKVAADTLGGIFTHDIRAVGAHYESVPLRGGPSTARCMIFVTPDGERSMCTYLGACVEFGPEDVDETVVAAAKVCYFEGYLWDPPRAKDGIRKAAAAAHAAGRDVAMTLSDSFCVHRHREEFLQLMRSGTVDIVFANEEEALALYETRDLQTALDAIGRDTRKVAVVTRSEKGCVVVEGGAQTAYPALRVADVADTTGAGDLFASGFLRGYTAGLDHGSSAALGAAAAAHIIRQMGPRPQVRLADQPEFAALLAGSQPAVVA